MTHELIEFFMTLGSFCRGIFKLLVKFQLENKDNPSYTGTHILKTLKRCTDFHLNFMILMFSFHCVQGCHSKISTSVVERHSWLTLTSLWGLSWLSSETTNWYGHARYSAVSIIPSSHSVSQLSAFSGVSHLTFIPMILQGGDGVEYLMVAVDTNTLTDFLENEEGDWEGGFELVSPYQQIDLICLNQSLAVLP